MDAIVLQMPSRPPLSGVEGGVSLPYPTLDLDSGRAELLDRKSRLNSARCLLPTSFVQTAQTEAEHQDQYPKGDGIAANDPA